MKQIQKCPHCHCDAIFIHDLCPNCGHPSRFEERGEPDYREDEKGRHPSYYATLEEEMSAAEKHGRILLGLIIGLMILPLVAWTLVNFFLLFDQDGTLEIPFFKVLIALLVGTWLFLRPWFGHLWSRPVLLVLSALLGVGLLAYAVSLLFQEQAANPVVVLAAIVYGLIYSWCGWQFWRSKDIPEFIRRQHRYYTTH